MAYFAEFQKRIQRQDWPACLELWQEYLYSDEVDVKELVNILHAFKNSPLAKQFGPHAEEALTLFDRISDDQGRFEALRGVVDTQTTNSFALAERVVQELTARFGQTPHFADKIRLVGLKTRKAFQGSISDFLLLNHMKKGAFVFHTAGWGAARITDISYLREDVSLDCHGRKRDLSFANAYKTLIPLSDTHFLARVIGDPDAVEEAAYKDPVALIRSILADLGPHTSSQLKDLLADRVIHADDWSKWWQQARAKLKKDPQIHQPESLKEPFYLLTATVSVWERFEKQLQQTKNFSERAELIHSFFKEHPQHANEIITILLNTALDQEAALANLLLIDEYCPKHDHKEALVNLINENALHIASIDELPLLALKKRFLSYLQQRDDWSELCKKYLRHALPMTLRDWLLKQALELNVLDAEVQKIIREHKNIDFLFYYMQRALEAKRGLPFSDASGLRALFEALLASISANEDRLAMRDLLKKVTSFITHQRFALVRQILQNAPLEYVKEYLLLISKCHILQPERQILCSLAYVVYPELSREKATKEEPIWATQAGYDTAQASLKQLATVETVENAKEIETARAHGDLRENAEYKFALERRSRLQSQIRTLSQQLNKARVLTIHDIDTSEVSVGTIVTLRHNDQQVQYTLLGPWEADPEQHILSFQSKLAHEMIGKHVGETVAINQVQFVIESISSYL